MGKRLKQNSGYTLVEMIIVIAIIAIMSGAGAFTISSIRTSQATSSMQKFDSELSGLEMTTFTTTSTTPDAVLERVSIYYADDYDSDAVSSTLDESVILIRKSDGQVLSGYGQYRFCKYNTTNTVGRVSLNQYTGGHVYGNN